MKFVVMAGGLGTKLWPVSNNKKPKQFQPMAQGKTLLQANIDSLLKRYNPTDIFISTNETYLELIKEQCPQIPQDNYIIEPNHRRDTGPAAGYALLKLSILYPNEPAMFYVQPVVVREPEEKYLDMIDGIEDLVKREKKLISGGQKPTYPDMGSDYLKLAKKVESKNDLEVYEVESFVDRLGDYEKTRDLLENNTVSTHCNHYSWVPSIALEAYKKYAPEWYGSLEEIKEYIGKPNEKEMTDKIYSEMAPGRIEVVTKEVFNNNNGLIVILPFKWTHISTWNDIYEYSEKDINSNVLEGNIISIDSKNSIVKGMNNKPIGIIGLEDIVIIDTEDALLVCPRNRAGDIKKILDELNK